MKKFKPLLLILSTFLLLAACDNTTKRADNAVSLMQDKIGQIVNSLYQIQDLENALQANLESDISNAGEDLTYFNTVDALVNQNVAQRQETIKTIQKTLKELTDLTPEISKIPEGSSLPVTDFQNILTMIENLNTDLTIYIEDYLANLSLEDQTFKSIGNPETNYETFFQIFDNINTLFETNMFNLDNVLKHFEPLNRTLVDTKIILVGLLEQ